jgi:hypothetical protein
MKKEKINLPLCLTNYSSCLEDIWGNGGIAPPFIDPHQMELSGQFHATAALPLGK